MCRPPPRPENCPADVLLLIDASYREGIGRDGPWDRNIKFPSYEVITALETDNPPPNGNRIAAVRCADFIGTLKFEDSRRVCTK